MHQLLFNCFGVVAVALGTLGIFLPLLPTTPFLILAAFCFSKSSPRFHQMLLHSPFLGRYLHSWETHRIIPLKAKLLATAMICSSVGWVLYTRELSLFVSISIALSVAAILGLIWHYPHHPETRIR